MKSRLDINISKSNCVDLIYRQTSRVASKVSSSLEDVIIYLLNIILYYKTKLKVIYGNVLDLL